MQTIVDFTLSLVIQGLWILVFPGIFFITFLALLWEWTDRKIYARLQNRMGPLHTGWRGILQPLMDFLKLLGKEDLTPRKANRRGFAAVPVVMLVMSLLLCMFLPIVDMNPSIAGIQGILSFEGDLILILFISTLMAFTIILAGYFSSNPFGQTGAARTGMLLISFEIPLILSIITPAALTGSLRVSTIMSTLGSIPSILGIHPILLMLLLAGPLVIFLIAIQAELERIPFDVSHAETEIVHGWQVEFSGKKLAMIHLAEDIMLVSGVGLAVTLFLGGPYLLEFIPLPIFQTFGTVIASSIVGWIYYTLVFMFKSVLVILILSNVRTVFGRWRIDQIVHAAWRYIVPISLVWLVMIQLVLGGL
ncbi:MAG: NADH-quinone oxidoreductase subunit H [Candidatus Thorarchaeota archaeon]|nr:NADH-quinone oxidoreductase subunit H [Candidatus Thorarchaeota archaeon]